MIDVDSRICGERLAQGRAIAKSLRGANCILCVMIIQFNVDALDVQIDGRHLVACI
jgi:hypothetical protein